MDETPRPGTSDTAQPPVEPVWHRPAELKPHWQRRLGLAVVLAVAALAVALLTSLGGWLGGMLYRRFSIHQERQKLLAELRDPAAAGPAGLVKRFEALCALLPDAPEERLRLAQAYLLAAEEAPAPALYRQEAVLAARQAVALEERRGGSDEAGRALRLGAADVLAEAGESRDALAIYEALLRVGADDGSLARATLLNNLAWLLATAQPPELREPARAHALAVRAVKQHPQASQEASFLDTLATTYYSIGDVQQALAVQRRALARAPRRRLAEYLRHFDLFAQAAETPGKGGHHGDEDR